jgi:hypothetical protein
VSEIDQYRHECLGIVHCPSTREIVAGDPGQRDVPLYLLLQDALDGDSFRGKAGDLLLGGGAGEAAALRISLPEAATAGHAVVGDLVQAYWSERQATAFADGYAKLGWSPPPPLEAWLAGHILAFVGREYPDRFAHDYGVPSFGFGGSICRRPTQEEKTFRV